MNYEFSSKPNHGLSCGCPSIEVTPFRVDDTFSIYAQKRTWGADTTKGRTQDRATTRMPF